MDWVSCLEYGALQTVSAGENAVVPLVRMPSAGTYDPHAFGGGPDQANVNPREFYVHRIVGQVFTEHTEAEARDYFVAWRLLALPWDMVAGTFEVPWVVGTNVLNNALHTDIVRWWAERYYRVTGALPDEPQGLNPVELPWYTQLDHEPKFVGGAHSDLWPCMILDNTSQAFDLGFRLRVRLLITQHE